LSQWKISLRNLFLQCVAVSDGPFSLRDSVISSKMLGRQVSRTLGSSKLSGDATFYWNTDGGNALGTLLVYARAAADWTLRLSSTNREVTERSPVDLPHFVKDPVRRFPFGIMNCGQTRTLVS
jgi:hypothetical protein